MNIKPPARKNFFYLILGLITASIDQKYFYSPAAITAALTTMSAASPFVTG